MPTKYLCNKGITDTHIVPFFATIEDTNKEINNFQTFNTYYIDSKIYLAFPYNNVCFVSEVPWGQQNKEAIEFPPDILRFVKSDYIPAKGNKPFKLKKATIQKDVDLFVVPALEIPEEPICLLPLHITPVPRLISVLVSTAACPAFEYIIKNHTTESGITIDNRWGMFVDNKYNEKMLPSNILHPDKINVYLVIKDGEAGVMLRIDDMYFVKSVLASTFVRIFKADMLTYTKLFDITNNYAEII